MASQTEDSIATLLGETSVLVPAGRSAERIADLSWWLFGSATLIWFVVLGLSVYAAYVRPGAHDVARVRLMIVGGGAVLPTILLGGVLAYSLWLMPQVKPPIPEGAVEIEVEGLRWWWRVRYASEEGGATEVANELALPVGRPAVLRLTSPDVIHSFWVPALAGKTDMIPGRETIIVLEPTRTGVFRGACAEYCGTSHALMNFAVLVLEPDAYEGWLARQGAPAQEPEGPLEARGAAVFREYGCGACHAIRGTQANGVVGPDLTHVGSRRTLGAGALPNTPEDYVDWIARTHEVKPDANMPPFGMLPDDDLAALAAYLDGLT
ncbi:cytochrome c oxidase subunit II [Salinarimonas ramus]|uniref:Cytochrome aa3 subunit 2 n=1 Tax=Salinarimonas ramus TaxID=690164 RepID=A0A917Q3R0_9HYPH|nr:cytochrome c oxidase subunit II [Salinarimonas ramus]GGK21152.1 cytochrome c oxidase subunit II [Salinarimonas ramus]